jgi:hypothetical protein
MATDHRVNAGVLDTDTSTPLRKNSVLDFVVVLCRHPSTVPTSSYIEFGSYNSQLKGEAKNLP